MRVLVMWADPTSGNLGVRALSEGTAAVVRSLWPAADFVHQVVDGRTAVGMRYRQLARASVLRDSALRRWFASFDLIVDTGAGDSFSDIYGTQRFMHMSAVRWLAGHANANLVLAPQTIGPFGDRSSRLVARRSVSGARAVLARDSVSARISSDVLKTNAVLSSDVVFALPQPSLRAGRKGGISFNVSGLLWNGGPHADPRRYREACVATCEQLAARGHRVSLLAHVLGEEGTDCDPPACRALAESLSFDPEVFVPSSLTAVREHLAQRDVVIASRMHACLNALSVGVPAIPWAYSRKFEPLLRDLGWSACLDVSDAHLARETVVLATDTREALRARTGSVASRARERLDRYRAMLRDDVSHDDVAASS